MTWLGDKETFWMINLVGTRLLENCQVKLPIPFDKLPDLLIYLINFRDSFTSEIIIDYGTQNHDETTCHLLFHMPVSHSHSWLWYSLFCIWYVSCINIYIFSLSNHDPILPSENKDSPRFPKERRYVSLKVTQNSQFQFQIKTCYNAIVIRYAPHT